MSVGASIRSGAKWLVAGNVGTRIFDFAFGIVLARLLVPADFGMIATISALTGFAGLFASGGMGQALIRAKTADEADFNAVFTLQLTLGVTVYIFFFFTAPFIAHYFNHPLYTDLIRVSALSFLLRPFLNMRSSWLSREMRFRSATLITVSSGLMTSATSCLMAWAGLGVWSLTLSGLGGAIMRNVMLARVTPLRLNANIDFRTMRKHSGYGAKITINDFLGYLIQESRNLVVSKLAGPAFLGLFNKGESLSRLPNQLMMSATMQPLFRGMSKMQDDLDATKYMFLRAITLLSVYTLPLYVGLWWVAGPFILVVYGEKWIAVSEPMRILLLMGVALNILGPCGVVLDAQNRLKQEMFALGTRLIITLLGIFVGVRWGLSGVAWALLCTALFSTVHYYVLVSRVIRTTFMDLFGALKPALLLGALLFFCLAAIDKAMGGERSSHPVLYLLLMTASGGVIYSSAFIFLPIKAIASETQRWRQAVHSAKQLILRANTHG